MSLYYESHVTIEPVFDLRRVLAGNVASRYGFRLAKLIMRKDSADAEMPSTDDTFMTANDKNLERLKVATIGLVLQLKSCDFQVRRYKIEDTILDSRISDELKLL